MHSSLFLKAVDRELTSAGRLFDTHGTSKPVASSRNLWWSGCDGSGLVSRIGTV